MLIILVFTTVEVAGKQDTCKWLWHLIKATFGTVKWLMNGTCLNPETMYIMSDTCQCPDR